MRLQLPSFLLALCFIANGANSFLFGQPLKPTAKNLPAAHKGIVEVEAEIQPSDPFLIPEGQKAPKWAPGEKFDLFIKVTPSTGWHGYPFSMRSSTQEVDYLSRLKLEPGSSLLQGGGRH